MFGLFSTRLVRLHAAVLRPVCRAVISEGVRCTVRRPPLGCLTAGVIAGVFTAALLSIEPVMCDVSKPDFISSADSEDTHRLILVAYDFITLKKEATLRGNMKGVDHLEKSITAIVEEITRRKSFVDNVGPRNTEFVVEINLTSPTTAIKLPVLIDGGCMFDLILETDDAILLGLSTVGVSSVVHADGRKREMVEYETVNVSIGFYDGSTVTRSVRPVAFSRSVVEPSNNDFVAVPQRLLGYPVLLSMGIKQDYKQHRLVRFVRRL